MRAAASAAAGDLGLSVLDQSNALIAKDREEAVRLAARQRVRLVINRILPSRRTDLSLELGPAV